MTVDDSVEAFEVLGDETRVAIIGALAAERRKSPGSRAVSFSELRDRTEIDDSGRFNYHLDKLVGQFVEQTEAGYRLNSVGKFVAGAVMSGYYEGDTLEIDGHELESCPLCDGILDVGYEDGMLRVGCSNNHQFNTWVPPRAFNGRTIESVVEVAATTAIGRLRQVGRGSCHLCFGTVEWELIPTEDNPDVPVAVVHGGQCQGCGAGYTTTPGTFALLAPMVQAELYAHGVTMWDAPVRWFIKCDEATIDSFDASTGRVTVTEDLDSVSLTVTTDERGDVRDLDIHEAGGG